MTANICEMCASTVQSFLMIWFISNFCGYKYSGSKKALGFIVILFLDTAVITVINHFTDYDGILSVISIFDMVIYARICLKGKLPEHIFTALFAMEIVFLIASLTSLIISNTHGESEYDLLAGFSGARLFILCFCRVAELAVFKAVLYVRERCNLTLKEWIMCIAVLFITWVEVMLFTKASMMADNIKGYMLGAAVAAVAVNFLIYYFILSINKAMGIKTELALVKMQYDNVKNTEKNMKALYESTYEIKHDLEKHFLYIKTMTENNEREKAIEYMNKLIHDKLNSAQKIVFTNNDVFNALMNIRLEICQQKHIQTNISIDDAAIDEIHTEDIAVLFGNIFDNAIEAAEKTDEKFIILSVCPQGDYISIYMENSFKGILGDGLSTTKSDGGEHGFGLKNTRKIVEKYDGMMKCFHEGDMFCCDILLKRN